MPSTRTIAKKTLNGCLFLWFLAVEGATSTCCLLSFFFGLAADEGFNFLALTGLDVSDEPGPTTGTGPEWCMPDWSNTG